MFNIENAVGRRYGCQLTVVAVGQPPPGGGEDDRPVIIHMNGDRFAISAGEFRTMVERGLLVEQGPR